MPLLEKLLFKRFVNNKLVVKELLAKIKELASKINKATAKLELETKAQKLEELKRQMSAADFWQEQNKAKSISTQASNLEGEINLWRNLERKWPI